jgi:hypothetical protein
VTKQVRAGVDIKGKPLGKAWLDTAARKLSKYADSLTKGSDRVCEVVLLAQSLAAAHMTIDSVNAHTTSETNRSIEAIGAVGAGVGEVRKMVELLVAAMPKGKAKGLS